MATRHENTAHQQDLFDCIVVKEVVMSPFLVG